VAWLTGSQKKKERTEMLALIASGEAALVVGTHAVIQEQVQFKKLALAIIDEQHRFGVAQRLALREKTQDAGLEPHLLMMSATPIPRTLAMSYYADLDVSTIDELPPGRTPIVTKVIADTRRDQVIERIRLQIESGRQAYWVCPLIEDSEEIEAQAAQTTFEQLSEALPELRVALLHGRMKPTEKQDTMRRFKAGELQLLVATTVIEVGVDVPNASLMVIENAERLGLAQFGHGQQQAPAAHDLAYRHGDGARGYVVQRGEPAFS
jgi:ATP-dependent DNA helicase RecG